MRTNPEKPVTVEELLKANRYRVSDTQEHGNGEVSFLCVDEASFLIYLNQSTGEVLEIIVQCAPGFNSTLRWKLRADDAERRPDNTGREEPDPVVEPGKFDECWECPSARAVLSFIRQSAKGKSPRRPACAVKYVPPEMAVC